MARKILVTGARGFVGSYLCAALATQDPEAELIALAAIDEGGLGYVAADLLDPAAVDAAIAQARPDVVVHLAAQASVARTAHDGSGTFAVNLGGSLNLALAIVRHVPDAMVLFASSSEVYGQSFRSGPVTETSPLLPTNAYATSKRLAEEMFAAVLPAEAKLIVARPFNHTGAGQREDFVLPSFAGQVARIEAGRQPPQMNVGNIDVRRDILDVRDVVDAYVALLDAAADLPNRFTCNIARGEARPLREHVESLRDMSHVPFEIVVDPARQRPVDVPVAQGDAALLRKMTRWTPKVTMPETLRDLLAAARETLAKEAARPAP